MTDKIICDKCGVEMQSTYSFCPKCGNNINAVIPENNSITKIKADQSNRHWFLNNQLLLRFLGFTILCFGLVVLIWFCWSSYIGYLVKFNKPIPDTIMSIDAAFFNLSGDDQLYKVYLIIFILFGMLKTGFWLLKRDKS